MVPKVRFEPTTNGLKVRCLCQLGYLGIYFGGAGRIRTYNVYLSEQIYSLPQHHRRCRPSMYGAESQNRTDNPSLTKRLLYLLSYFSTLILFWSEW